MESRHARYFSAQDDLNDDGMMGDLDYMHARYYSPHLGRFLSVDPVIRNTRNPQTWNRYAYVRGNPLKYVDPTGTTVSLAGLSDTEIQKLLESLAEATGNDYEVDDEGNLALVEAGGDSSEAGTKIVDDLINADQTFEVQSCSGCGIRFAGVDPASNQLFIDFSDFQHLDFGSVTPGSFGLGAQFLHEGLHLLNPGLTDPSSRGARGFFVDQVNQVRRERGFDLRDSYLGLRDYGEVKMFFEAQGIRKFLGMRKKVRFPFDEVSLGPPPPR